MENPSQSGETSGIQPSLTLNGFSLQLPSTETTLDQAFAPSVPRIPIPPKRSGRLIRPSTASAVEERTSILPSVSNGTTVEVITPDSSPGKESAVRKNMTLGARDDKEAVLVKNPSAENSHPTLGSLPSLFEGDACDDTTPAVETTVEYDYDWATFMSAYAAGRWDPRRTPNPPRSCHVISSHHSYSQSTSTDLGLSAWTVLAHETSDSGNDAIVPSDSVVSRHQPNSKNPQVTVTSEDTPQPILPENKVKRPGMPLKLPAMAISNLRNFSADLRVHSPHTSPSPNADQAVSPFNPELTTAAATMRWAAARVNLAPLALPSPEHELTDPMRGVTASIPGFHNDPSTEPMTPGGSRKMRLPSFWEGTQDVENIRSGRLSTIEGSPSGSAQDTPPSIDPEAQRSVLPFPASAPLVHSTEESVGDYFAGLDTSPAEMHLPPQDTPPIIRRPTSPSVEGTASVPVLPRRACLIRQVSSPLPESTRLERYSPGRVASDNKAPARMSRAAKEEQIFAELGYLAPPNPPDEWERRRALSKFNIWNTGPDLNFDRIAHLAKLVFNTKGVYISLVDGDEHFLKSKWGMSLDKSRRVHTFCAHTILQRGDEPMVILDTQSDWRFAKHPYVTGPPNIRFYAGAPLRTQEGYNIGTLSVTDDSPRENFSPRQRHTLKEFAAIAMREMELWRDKIQLRIRDRIQTSMEQFSRECLEIETEVGDHIEKRGLTVGASMERVYDRAAKLVKRTLDVEGVIVMDISHCEVLETMSAEGAVSVVIHHGDPHLEMKTQSLSQDEYSKLTSFFSANRDGKISEGIVPSALRTFLPTRIQYALTVPIFNIDKRPFALLCAYNSAEHPNRFLEGHELSYLRAIGVIILSAVLKRRMILADKAKSLFISNISHELRTPLHGILAAAELLTDTPLDANQISFLQTVQACGTSLVETVNHVLDFTKLSGNSKSGGVENMIIPSKVDLMQLVEEAIDGGWIGHLARMSAQNSEIGSVYSPPSMHPHSDDVSQPASGGYVETIVEIGYREKGWLFKCERGGIRRVLMNLLGNSLKFTYNGFVHIGLRELPRTDEMPENGVKIELSVLDTGKGISQNFLKNQLFHPFSQEDPLQTGTGLGLAIVNSIVQSDSVGGKVEVWSEEGVGTEIKVIFTAEAVDDDDDGANMEPLTFDDPAHLPTVSLIAFKAGHKGVELLRAVLSSYLTTWWGFVVQQNDNSGDIIIINEDPTLVQVATHRRDISRPFIVLSASRGDAKILAIANDHERIGGFCRVLYKPGGPSRLRSALKICLNILKIRSRRDSPSPYGQPAELFPNDAIVELHRHDHSAAQPPKPRHHTGKDMLSHTEDLGLTTPPVDIPGARPLSGIQELEEPSSLTLQGFAADLKSTGSPTIPIGSGGSLLKSSVGIINAKELRYRVLVVEDNSILRNLIVKWLKAKGHEFRDAVDGRDGVNIYESEGPFDIVLLDLSMPKLDGIGATTEIRQIESARHNTSAKSARERRAGILALTGMSSLEDKRRAFDAGVDGYLVKPVAFKTLEEIFQKLGANKPE